MPVNYSAFPVSGEISFADIRDGLGLGNNAPLSMSELIASDSNSVIPERNSFFSAKMAIPRVQGEITLNGFHPLPLDFEFFDSRGGTWIAEDEFVDSLGQAPQDIARVRIRTGKESVPAGFQPLLYYTLIDSSQINSLTTADFDDASYEGTVLFSDLDSTPAITANLKGDYDNNEGQGDRIYLRIPNWQGNFISNRDGGAGSSDSDNTGHILIVSDYSQSVVNPRFNDTSEDAIETIDGTQYPILASSSSGFSYAASHSYTRHKMKGWTAVQSGTYTSVHPTLGTLTYYRGFEDAGGANSPVLGANHTGDILTGRLLQGPSYSGGPFDTGYEFWQWQHNGNGFGWYTSTYGSVTAYNASYTNSAFATGGGEDYYSLSMDRLPIGSSIPGLGVPGWSQSRTIPAFKFSITAPIGGNSGSDFTHPNDPNNGTYKGWSRRVSGTHVLVSKEYGLTAGTKLRFKWAVQGRADSGYDFIVYLVDRRTDTAYQMYTRTGAFGNLDEYSNGYELSDPWVNRNTSSGGHNKAVIQIGTTSFPAASSCMPYVISTSPTGVPHNSQYNICVVVGLHDAYPKVNNVDVTGGTANSANFAFTDFEFIRPSTNWGDMTFVNPLTFTSNPYDLSLDISQSTNSGTSLDISSQTGGGTNASFTWKPDGTSFFVSYGSNAQGIRRWNLTTAWDLSTATYTSSQNSPSWNTIGTPAASDMVFKPDGTKIWILDGNNKNIYEIDMSTAWDLTTATYSNVNYTTPNIFGGSNKYWNSINVSPDGTRMILGSNVDPYIRQFNISSGWDLSSSITDAGSSYSFSLAATDAQATSTIPTSDQPTIHVNSDGTILFVGAPYRVSGPADNTVYQFNMSTAWDVSTLTWEGSSKNLILSNTSPGIMSTQFDFIAAINASASGDKLYVIDQRNSIPGGQATIYEIDTGQGYGVDPNAPLREQYGSGNDFWFAKLQNFDPSSYFLNVDRNNQAIADGYFSPPANITDGASTTSSEYQRFEYHIDKNGIAILDASSSQMTANSSVTGPYLQSEQWQSLNAGDVVNVEYRLNNGTSDSGNIAPASSQTAGYGGFCYILEEGGTTQTVFKTINTTETSASNNDWQTAQVTVGATGYYKIIFGTVFSSTNGGTEASMNLRINRVYTT